MIGKFIDIKYLNQYSPISKSLDKDMIELFIETAQETHTANCLGGGLYLYLQTQIANSLLPIPIPINALDKQLIELCRSALVWWISADLLIPNAIQLRAKGVVRNTGDTVEPAAMEDIQVLKNEFKSKANMYELRVQDFLCKNYNTYSAIDSTIKPFREPNQIVGGIYMPNIYNDNCKCNGNCICNWNLN